MAFLCFIIVLSLIGISSSEVISGYKQGVPTKYYFYKFHTDPKIWNEASLVCQSENAQLAVIHSEEELKLFIAEFARFPASSIQGDFYKDSAHIGIHNKFSTGWITVDGAPLGNSGYFKWHVNEPSGDGSCGTIFRDGTLNDAPCGAALAYFCVTTEPLTHQLKCEEGKNCYQKSVPAEFSYYKLHTNPRTWNEASLVCQSENGQLAVINSDEEENLFIQEFARFPASSLSGDFYKYTAFLGIHDRIKHGDWITMDGTLLGDSGFSKWGKGEPNGDGFCGSMFREGLLNDAPCDNTPLLFFCESNHPFIESEQICDDARKCYKQGVPMEYSYYKFHPDPRNWNEANLVCQAENGHLAVLHSEEENNLLIAEFAKFPPSSIAGDFYKYSAHLGFHHIIKHGDWITIDGTPLSKTGFSKWGKGEPSGDGQCGTMFREGPLNDAPCDDTLLSFFCQSTHPSSKQVLPEPEANCDDWANVTGYTRGVKTGGHFFKIHDGYKTWDDATMVCQSERAQLAIINSEEEAMFYSNELNKLKQPTSGTPDEFIIMLGYHDRIMKGNFKTLDGLSLNEAGYSKWSPGQPDQSGEGRSCGGMFTNGLLTSVQCDKANMFICERPYIRRPSNINKFQCLSSDLRFDHDEENNTVNEENVEEQAQSDIISENTTGPLAYRNDYIYLKDVNVYVKFNNKRKTWFVAKSICDAEGAKLAVIRTSEEAHAIKRYFNKTQRAWIGLQDLISEGDFETIDAEPISDVYENWDTNEPNESEGSKCVLFQTNGKLKATNCLQKERFICTKDLYTIMYHEDCESFVSGYKPAAANQCIKFHNVHKTWDEAYMICNAEQAHLAVINSAKEAQFYKTEFGKYPTVGLRGQIETELVHMGFHDKFRQNDYTNVYGQNINEGGYSEWAPGQPENKNKENCGSMTRSGLLHVIDCKRRAYFICEKNLLDVSDVSLFSRIAL